MSKLRSRLFSSFDVRDKENEGFIQDLKSLMKFDPADQKEIAKAAADVDLARTGSDEMRVIESLEERTGRRAVDLVRPLRFGRFLLKSLDKDTPSVREDTPEMWADDLVALKIVSGEQKARFLECATFVRNEIFPYYEKEGRRVRFEGGAFPSFNSFASTVELRGVTIPRFKFDDALDKYKPKVEGVIGVASILIGVDSGTPEKFCFQVTGENLNKLIDQLQATKKDLEALEKKYKVR